jgi:hypothetical protein
MTTSAEIRAEIEHLRALMWVVTDARARAAMLDMIREHEARARALDDGSAETESGHEETNSDYK